MKDLSSRAVSSYCPACLRAVVNAQCTVCGDLTITPVEQWETRVGSWTCDALIYHDSQEELYHVSRGQTGG
ncbi:hypothetical protein KKF84_12015, partial [Myxococcota bacterium]|nr:hypothetical protein [Myxococcota bacterium]